MYIIGGLKDVKKYKYLTLCFAIILVVFTQFSSKNTEKQVNLDAKIEASENAVKIEEIDEKEEVVEESIVTPEPVKKYRYYRLTSFWANDGYGTTSCTGSGLCENDFSVNDKGWYTYNGKLVLAGATYECLNAKRGSCGNWNEQRSDKRYYHYYDTVEIIIDGLLYEGIILDSCGACMYINGEERLDLFVSGKDYAIDRGYKGNNSVAVFKEER